MNDDLKSKAGAFQEKLLDIANPDRWFRRKKKEPKGPVHYASFNDRAFATVIDTIVVTFLFSRLFYLLSKQIYGGRSPDVEILNAWSQSHNAADVAPVIMEFANVIILNNLLQIVLIGLLFVPLWHFTATSPGKWLLRMRIVDAATGLHPTNRQSIIRFLGYFVSSIPVFQGFLWIIIDKKKQAWHDKMAHTVVIKVKHWRLLKSSESEFPGMPVAEEESRDS